MSVKQGGHERGMDHLDPSFYFINLLIAAVTLDIDIVEMHTFFKSSQHGKEVFDMPSLFDALTINRLELRNSFLRSATMETLGNRGKVTDDLLALYRELATGDIGLIISGGIFVRKDGQIAPGELAADTDETIPSLKRLADTAGLGVTSCAGLGVTS